VPPPPPGLACPSFCYQQVVCSNGSYIIHSSPPTTIIQVLTLPHMWALWVQDATYIQIYQIYSLSSCSSSRPLGRSAGPELSCWEQQFSLTSNGNKVMPLLRHFISNNLSGLPRGYPIQFGGVQKVSNTL
jgi:hypothetical protein